MKKRFIIQIAFRKLLQMFLIFLNRLRISPEKEITFPFQKMNFFPQSAVGIVLNKILQLGKCQLIHPVII